VFKERRKLRYGQCPKCKEARLLTKHYIFPKRYFGKGAKNNHIALLCRECHDELEKRIPFSKMPKLFYNQILNEFLREEINA